MPTSVRRNLRVTKRISYSVSGSVRALRQDSRDWGGRGCKLNLQKKNITHLYIRNNELRFL